ncbi:hypothetical protein [Labrys monachus]|uniref:DUF2188 domain-containing protein n=1 Tax=Labrys monachus TaxID=217067 RepID=A0ABU0FE44_9HYPH|nr:hypothetical protein [Labrys monachus]MDQ0392796.1 hypothetical protein [Labrys monachus]
MKDAVYRISRSSAGWMIHHEETSRGPYELPEAAFDVAVSSASRAIKEGIDVTISLRFSDIAADSPAGLEDSEPSIQRSRYDFES